MAPQDKRRQLMRATEKLFKSRRFHEITLDDVIRIAGVGKGTVYHYFKNKDDLFFQTAASGFEYLRELLECKVPREAPFERQLLVACKEISSFFKHRHQLFRMMQAQGAAIRWRKGQFRRQWLTGRRKLTETLAEIISRGVDEGDIRLDIPPFVLAGILLGMLRTRAHELADLPESARSHEILVDLFCRGAGRLRGVKRIGRKPPHTAGGTGCS